MLMSSANYVRPDPLTFKVIRKSTTRESEKIREKVRECWKENLDYWKKREKGKALNLTADCIVKEIKEEIRLYHKELEIGKSYDVPFVILPADTRFPGFLNSIGDHMITTSAFAVSVALSMYDKGLLGDVIYPFLGNNSWDREILRGFIRLAALLHDLGKMPPCNHAERSYEYIKKIFSEDGELAEALALTASRHHYGKYTSQDRRPSNILEWIVAFADKVSSSSRSIVFRETDLNSGKESMMNFLRRTRGFKEIGYNIGSDEDLKRIEDLIRNGHVEEDEDFSGVRTYGFLDRDEKASLRVNNMLINSEQKLLGIVNAKRELLGEKGEERLVSMYFFEIPSIKSYVSRGTSLKVYAGYSLLIDYLNHEISRRIQEKVGPECVISDEGGSVLAITPSTFKTEEILTGVLDPEKGELRFFKYRDFKEDFLLSEFFLGPKEVWEGWGEKSPYLRDSVRSFGSLVSKFLSHASSSEIKPSSELGKERRIPINNTCKECKMNPKEEGDLCGACKLAQDMYVEFRNSVQSLLGGKAHPGKRVEVLRAFNIIRELIDDLKESKKDVAGIKVPITVDEWDEDHGGSGWIAFFDADGDNFGKLKSNATTLTQYIAILNGLSFYIYYSIERGLLYTIEKKGEVNFVPLILGGDDIIFLLRGDDVFLFSEGMDMALKNATYSRRGGELERKATDADPYMWFGISAGVFLSNKVDYPFILGKEEAERLQGISKEYSKTKVQSKLKGAGLITSFLSSKFGGTEEVSSFPGLVLSRENVKGLSEYMSEFYKSGLNTKNMRELLKYIKEDKISLTYKMQVHYKGWSVRDN